LVALSPALPRECAREDEHQQDQRGDRRPVGPDQITLYSKLKPPRSSGASNTQRTGTSTPIKAAAHAVSALAPTPPPEDHEQDGPYDDERARREQGRERQRDGEG
jgi:hypothetical protein